MCVSRGIRTVREWIRLLATVSGQSATDSSVLAVVSGHFGMNPNISLGIRKVRDVSETSERGYLYFMFLLIEIIPDGCLLQLVSS